MAPTAVDGKILIGTNGGEYGIRGFVKAYDASSGNLLWTFDTIPENSAGVWATKDATGRDEHRDIDGGEGGAGRRTATPTRRSAAACGRTPRSISQTSASTSWSATPRLTSTARSGRATICTPTRSSRLDLDTGKYVCHFQYVPHDVWDLDAVSPTVLVNAADKNGKMIPAVMHAGKTGYVYVNDRKDCSLIRFSEPMVSQKDRWTLPTPTKPLDPVCAHVPRRERRRRMVADGDRSDPRTRLCDQPPAGDDLHGRDARPIPTASCGSAAPSPTFRTGSRPATSPRSTTTPARSPGRSRRRSR